MLAGSLQRHRRDFRRWVDFVMTRAFCEALCMTATLDETFAAAGAESIDPETQRVNDALDALLTTHDPSTMDNAEFRGARFDAGLAWVHFAEGDGGLGVRPELGTLLNAGDQKGLAQALVHWCGLKASGKMPSDQSIAGYAQERFTPAAVGRTYVEAYRAVLL